MLNEVKKYSSKMRTKLKLASLDIRMWPSRHQMSRDIMEEQTCKKLRPEWVGRDCEERIYSGEDRERKWVLVLRRSCTNERILEKETHYTWGEKEPTEEEEIIP